MRVMRRVGQYMYHLGAYDSLSFDNFIPLCRWRCHELSTSFVKDDQ
jgi:hypothetical protein